MDLLGNALSDYYKKTPSETLWVHNNYDQPEGMPVDVFFRDLQDMPDLELVALEHCKGSTLDIGAGAGAHALALQERHIPVTALDISPRACAIMKERGVKIVENRDFFTLQEQKFDTLLFLMNGIGLTGTISGLEGFLSTARNYLNPEGQIIFDSSDIAYLYEGNIQRPGDKYYGEISYRYGHKGLLGDWFNWLYADQRTLKSIATKFGWTCSIVYEDGQDQYLAILR